MNPAANINHFASLCNKVRFLPLQEVVDPCSLSLAVDLKYDEVVNEELLNIVSLCMHKVVLIHRYHT